MKPGSKDKGKEKDGLAIIFGAKKPSPEGMPEDGEESGEPSTSEMADAFAGDLLEAIQASDSAGVSKVLKSLIQACKDSYDE